MEEALELVAKDQRKQQRNINFFKNLKHIQGYKDCKQGKKQRYPLEDAEEEASKDKVGSKEYKKDENAKVEKEKEEIRDAEEEVPDKVAQTKETSEAPSKILSV